MDLRLKEDWAEILRCALRPLTALLGVYYEALSPTTATARSGLGYCIYYKYTLRPPLWIPLVLGEVRSFWNLRDSSRQFYPLDHHARGTRSSSTGSIWIFLAICGSLSWAVSDFDFKSRPEISRCTLSYRYRASTR